MSETIDEVVLAVDGTGEENLPNLKVGDEIIEMEDDFDLGEFQVVRREFFAHIREPSITLVDFKVGVNQACLTKFPNTNYAQVLINREKKILALRPCEEGARDSFLWCNPSGGKRKPKLTSCKIFFAKIFSLMGWNPQYRYKILGKLIRSKGEYLLAFDLTATEVYQRIKDGEKVKMSRTPVFPEEWQHQFGMPYSQHQQTMQINIFDGYAVYSIKETGTQATTDSPVGLLPAEVGGTNNDGQ